jgi:chaperonin cofactor prefoldin
LTGSPQQRQMLQMITEAKREAVHRKIDLFLNQLTNGKAETLKPYLYEIIDAVIDEAQELHQRKADSSDLRELIIEMREGFKRMDARFEQMEKRFEQIDKRFEDLIHYVDKRFEDLLHYMDKRFEQVDKRFEQIDKRFEQIDKRFEQIDKRFEAIDARFNRLYHFLMWMMGVIATGFFGLYLKLFFLK